MNDICVGDGMNRLWRDLRWKEGIRPKPPIIQYQNTEQGWNTLQVGSKGNIRKGV